MAAIMSATDGRVSTREQLLRALADGRFHSGEQLAEQFAISRAAVWKHLRQLADEFGLEIQAVRGRGYRLSRPVDLLDGAVIRSGLSQGRRAALQRLEVLARTDSTNDRARADPVRVCGKGQVWLAEVQTAGRGRHGRRWVSAFGGNLTLSVGWRFDQSMRELGGLSLACGAVLARVLADQGLTAHRLKWPNDIVVGHQKLGGILVELVGEAHGPTDAVIGFGLNVDLPSAAATAIDQPWTDLAAAGMVNISRNRIAAAVIDALIGLCQEYPRAGLAGYMETWRQYDACTGMSVSLVSPNRRVDGVYRYVDADGAVVIDTGTGLRSFHAGELSLRIAPGSDA